MATGKPQGCVVVGGVDSATPRPKPSAASPQGAVPLRGRRERRLHLGCFLVVVSWIGHGVTACVIGDAQEMLECPCWVLARLHQHLADDVVGEVWKDALYLPDQGCEVSG